MYLTDSSVDMSRLSLGEVRAKGNTRRSLNKPSRMAGQAVPCPASQSAIRWAPDPPRILRDDNRPNQVERKRFYPRRISPSEAGYNVSSRPWVRRLTEVISQTRSRHATNVCTSPSLPIYFDNSLFSHKFSVSCPMTTMPDRRSYSSFYKRSVIAMPLHYSGPLTSPLYLSEHIRLTASNT